MIKTALALGALGWALGWAPVGAATMSCEVEGHWRDVAYQQEPMKRYEELKSCIAWTAYQF